MRTGETSYSFYLSYTSDERNVHESDAFWNEVRVAVPRRRRSAPTERARETCSRNADTARARRGRVAAAAHDEPTPFMEQSVWQLIDANRGSASPARSSGRIASCGQLGHGGMGTVFLAVREGGDFTQRVAIKLVRGGEMLVQRFRQERQILASLEHPEHRPSDRRRHDRRTACRIW
jgi:hypothetical protein